MASQLFNPFVSIPVALIIAGYNNNNNNNNILLLLLLLLLLLSSSSCPKPFSAPQCAHSMKAHTKGHDV